MPTTIYHYKHDTKEYLGESVASNDPLEGLPLVPRFATTLRPPAVTEDQKPVFTEDGEWNVADDFRGLEYWDSEGVANTIITLGEVLPEGATLAEPPITLNVSRQLKMEALTRAAGNAIVSGMESDVLGSTHTYPTDRDSQSNLRSLVIAGIDSEFLCLDADGLWLRRAHTLAQLSQLHQEGITFIKSILNELDTRREALLLAESPLDIDLINEDFGV